MATPRELADAAFRRRRTFRQSPQFAANLPPAPTLADMTKPPEDTSTFARPPAPPAPPARRDGRALRAGLGAALTGAAAAAAAPVSSTPGQEFRQSLVRGLIGAGTAYGQERNRAEAGAARDQSFAERMALLNMRPKKATPQEAAEAERLKAEARLPSQLKRIEAQNSAITGRMEKMKTAAINKAKNVDEARWRAAAWDDAAAWAREKFRETFTMPSDAEMSVRAEKSYEWISKGKKPTDDFKFIKNPDDNK